jgi:pyrroloquinoline quinone biosynthesis protein B
VLLVEATPRIEEQVAMLHRLAGVRDRGRRPVDAVLLTHAHVGHYLGLLWFGREVAATAELPAWCSPRMAAFLRSNGPWRQLVELRQLALHECAPRAPFAPLPGLEVTRRLALQVAGSRAGQAVLARHRTVCGGRLADRRAVR